jgi:tetratricopeptide (TPR) repeat protein
VGKETPWEAWNARILENVQAVVRDNRGRRVAIVFGAAHGYYLIDALSKAEGVRILPCSSFFPLSPEEIRSRTTPKDHLLALRPLNFGFVPPEKQAALERHLDALKDVPEYRGDADLFAGKFLLAKGEFEGAVAAFRKVASLGDEHVSRFDGATRLNEAGGLYAGIALARQGKRAEARDQIKTLLQKAGLSAPMKQAAEQLLKELGPE